MTQPKDTYYTIKIPKDADVEDVLKNLLNKGRLDRIRKKMAEVNIHNPSGLEGGGTFAEIPDDDDDGSSFIEVIRK